MKLLRPQSSRLIAFRMSKSPACPISPHGSFRESCHAMNSGPPNTASATVAFCDPNATHLHKCTKLMFYIPMKESLLVLLEKTAINMDGSALRISGNLLICASPRFREIDCKSCSSVRDARESSLASQSVQGSVTQAATNRHHTLSFSFLGLQSVHGSINTTYYLRGKMCFSLAISKLRNVGGFPESLDSI